MKLAQEWLQLLVSVAMAFALPLAAAYFVPKLQPLPALFSFSAGFWQTNLIPMEKRNFPELQSPVDIAFDKYGIPHIVAGSQQDLYFAQGVLSAYFRLFEMDVSTRVATGRLSEMVGPLATNFDRFFVRFNLRQTVRDETTELMKDPEVAKRLGWYLQGVNAYIRGLSYRDLPLEYKLTGNWPEEWGPERVASLLKIMTFRLAGRSNDLLLTDIVQRLGNDKAKMLFPEFLPNDLEAFFVESGWTQARQDFSWDFPAASDFKTFPDYLQPLETNGSNAWAVAPDKSKTGHSILANDTHLGLQLPAVWFEMQLISPEVNVYGADFPGAPGVVLGFNKDVAWGTTNGTTDVLDWFQVEFKDPTSNEYKFGNEWRVAKVVSETVHIKNKPDEKIDVVTTDYGVLMDRQGVHGLVARWEGHTPSLESKVIAELDVAHSVKECIEALKDWKSPIQNFVCADKDNISIYHAGRVPLRDAGKGRVVEIADGENSLWKGDIPFEKLPHEENPERGFVFSANQRPTGPDYPFYLGWDFEEPFRGKRIRAELSDKRKLDGADLMQIQNDVVNEHASLALPILLKHLQVEKLSEAEKNVASEMKQWDFFEGARVMEPSVFDLWWKSVEKKLWHSLAGDNRPWYPKKARTIWFFREADREPEKYAEWWAPYKSLTELVTAAFQESVKDLTDRFGSNPSGWQWSKLQITELPHVGRFPGLASEPFLMDGGAYSIQANKGHHGPAWKLVVEMGEKPQAWSQFPGGVTGNPLDPEYEKFVDTWSRGEMRSVQFWQDPKEAKASAAYIWHWGKR